MRHTHILVILGAAFTVAMVLAVGSLCCAGSADACHDNGRHVSGTALAAHTAASAPLLTPTTNPAPGSGHSATAARIGRLTPLALRTVASANTPIRI